MRISSRDPVWIAIPPKRTFGGKVFSFWQAYSYKSEAREEAMQRREHGIPTKPQKGVLLARVERVELKVEQIVRRGGKSHTITTNRVVYAVYIATKNKK